MIKSGIITVDGKQYRKIDRVVKAGDFVRFVGDEDDYCDLTLGKLYKIELIDDDGDGIYYDDAKDQRCIFSNTDSDFEIVEPVINIASEIEAIRAKLEELEKMQSKEQRLKVGDYAKVIANEDGHGAEFGDNVKIISDDEDDLPFECTTFDGSPITGSWFNENELIRATPEEVAEAKHNLEKKKIVVGAYVKITIPAGKHPTYGWGSVCNGDIGKVKSVYGNTLVIDFPKSSHWNGTTDEVTLVSEQEAKQLEETEKWAKIGRKVGEFKNGDIVKVANAGSSELYLNEIGTITQIDGEVFRVGNRLTLCNWVESKYAELIAPVESVVNLSVSE